MNFSIKNSSRILDLKFFVLPYYFEIDFVKHYSSVNHPPPTVNNFLVVPKKKSTKPTYQVFPEKVSEANISDFCTKSPKKIIQHKQEINRQPIELIKYSVKVIFLFV